MWSIDRGGDALMLNECGGCVAGELKIESLIMGACVLPSQAFAGVWPTFVISLAGAVRKGLSFGDLSFVVASSRAFSLANNPWPCSPLTLPAEGSTPRRQQKLRIGKANVDALQEPRLATGSTALQGGASEWPLF